MESVEEKKRIELPKALREIVKILSEEGPKAYGELAEKLNKDETTIIRQCQKLVELEVATKIEKEGKAGIALAEGVEVDDEGNVYVPSPFEEPSEKLKALLEEAGIKGRKLRWIMRLVETNPNTLEQPQLLYDTLIGAGIRRHLSEQIVKAFFGTDFKAPQPPTVSTVQRPYPPYGLPYYSHDRELLRLEMRLERLMEELREKREEKPSYPVVRRVKTDETGKPIEVIEEPAWVARSDDSTTKLLLQMMQQQQKDREDLLKTVFTLQQGTSKTIEKILSAMQQMQQQTQQQLQQLLMEMEKKRLEETTKMKEEMYKRDMEWLRKFYEDKIKDLEQAVEGIKKYYEERTEKLLNDLKKEWEWKEKIRELEERRGVRDIVVDEIKSLAEEGRETFKQLRQQVRDYIEMQMKQSIVRKEVPEVSEEEKRRILESLKKRTGRTEERKTEETRAKPEKEETKVQLKIVGKGK